MASLFRRPNGHYWVQFIWSEKKHTVRLGGTSESTAKRFADLVSQLVWSRRAGVHPDPVVAAWIEQLPDGQHEKLSRIGLVVPRPPSLTLRQALNLFERRSDVKDSTKKKWKTVGDHLIEFFNSSTLLTLIDDDDAIRFQEHLQSHHANATANKYCKIARQVWDHAKMPRNPFKSLRLGSETNPSRKRIVSRELIDKVLKVCDTRTALVLLLARYGGLRVPTEVTALRRDDIIWDPGLMRVTSPKTERYEGHDHRMVPIFPELRGILRKASNVAESEGREHLIPEGTGETALRSAVIKRLRRAGVKPWPRLFQNLRATRETELADEYPLQVVTAWIGNSAGVAAKHYLQVTPEHVSRATGGEAKSEAIHDEN